MRGDSLNIASRDCRRLLSPPETAVIQLTGLIWSGEKLLETVRLCRSSWTIPRAKCDGPTEILSLTLCLLEITRLIIRTIFAMIVAARGDRSRFSLRFWVEDAELLALEDICIAIGWTQQLHNVIGCGLWVWCRCWRLRV